MPLRLQAAREGHTATSTVMRQPGRAVAADDDSNHIAALPIDTAGELAQGWPLFAQHVAGSTNAVGTCG